MAPQPKRVSIANTALPTIARELGISAASSIWIVNAYQIAMMAALLPLAALGDNVGHRRVFIYGAAVFTFSSLICGVSSFRFVSALLCTCMFPSALIGIERLARGEYWEAANVQSIVTGSSGSGDASCPSNQRYPCDRRATARTESREVGGF